MIDSEFLESDTLFVQVLKHSALNGVGFNPKFANVDLKSFPNWLITTDLAPCDFNLFLSLKCHLKGKPFYSDEELKSTTEDWLDEQDKNFYWKGTEQLC